MMHVILHFYLVLLHWLLFVHRDDTEAITSLDDVYQIGTFAQIHEMQDLGDKLRIVVMAHRRIKILGQIFDSEEPPTGELRKCKQADCCGVYTFCHR